MLSLLLSTLSLLLPMLSLLLPMLCLLLSTLSLLLPMLFLLPSTLSLLLPKFFVIKCPPLIINIFNCRKVREEREGQERQEGEGAGCTKQGQEWIRDPAEEPAIWGWLLFWVNCSLALMLKNARFAPKNWKKSYSLHIFKKFVVRLKKKQAIPRTGNMRTMLVLRLFMSYCMTSCWADWLSMEMLSFCFWKIIYIC